MEAVAVLALILVAMAAAAPAAAQDGPRIVQPGAPGEGSRVLSAAELARHEAQGYTQADVRFMQDMIHHHAQALEMSALAHKYAGSDAVRILARRIEANQDAEIALMTRWLEARGEPVPEILPTIRPPARDHDGHHHHHHHHREDDHHHPHAGMPGMLSPEQMLALASARGTAFDRLFLELMIFHHEGAIEMVETLFASPGAGQETTMFWLASHIDADQRAEIARMQALLQTLPQPQKE